MQTLTTEELLELAPEAVPLPHTTIRVVQMINRPETTADELAAVLEDDQALTARLLRVANSAYYGLPRQISSVAEAVVMLGLNTLRSLVLTASIGGVLGRQLAGYSLGRGELWRHSLSAARAARWLADRIGMQPDEPYAAGLLHDIGKVVMGQYMADTFDRAIDLARESSIPHDQAEREVFGVDHAEIGGALAESWELPPPLVDAIRHHHRPSDAKFAPKLTCLIHVVDLACLELGVGLGRDGLQYLGDPRAFSTLDLAADDFAQLTAWVADGLGSLDLDTMTSTVEVE